LIAVVVVLDILRDEEHDSLPQDLDVCFVFGVPDMVFDKESSINDFKAGT